MRSEKDFLGYMEISSTAYYGINAARGLENFGKTGTKPDSVLIQMLACVKKACAAANLECNAIDESIAKAIMNACDEMQNGKFDEEFIVNMIQGGGGTSLNMTANEIISNLALGMLGYKKGQYEFVNPLKHVNMSQSTNDVFPTAINLTLILKLKPLLKILDDTVKTLQNKAREASSVIKMGRTHLNAASPISLGQCIEAYASSLKRDRTKLKAATKELSYVPLGGTVIGTGLNTSAEYRKAVLKHLREISGINVIAFDNLADGIQNTDIYLALSSALKTCMMNLSKIASDLRLLGSDPKHGIGELQLPPRQLGSSIIPGKVNPVIPELINQVYFLICGFDLSINMAAQAGQLELNVFKPTISFCLFESIEFMTQAIQKFDCYCLKEIVPLGKHEIIRKEENALILELCKFVKPNKTKIESLIMGAINWPYVLGQLLFHRMGGAAYYVLSQCGLLGRVNREVRNSLKTVYDSGKIKSSSLKASLSELAMILQNTEFPFALLKGAHLVSLYPEGLRTSNDLDILINQSDLTALEARLKSSGFVQGNIRNGTFVPALRTEILSSRMNRGETVPFIKRINLPGMEFLEIDINFSLDFKATQENKVLTNLLENTKPLIKTENGNLPTLAPTDFFIHLCCHLYKEATVYAWVEMERDLSLYKFADLYLLLNQWTSVDLYDELTSKINEYELNHECYYALLRTKELFEIQNEALEKLLNSIRPENIAYLAEIIQPDKNKKYRYDKTFSDWLFSSGRKEQLYEIANESA